MTSIENMWVSCDTEIKNAIYQEAYNVIDENSHLKFTWPPILVQFSGIKLKMKKNSDSMTVFYQSYKNIANSLFYK